MRRKRKHSKTKRQQPRPKVQKRKVEAKHTIVSNNLYLNRIRNLGKCFRAFLNNKENILNFTKKQIDWVEICFKKYDTVQLLGGIGLYLLDNLPTIEKMFMTQVEGKNLQLDEDAEVIAEYAMNFGLAMPNEGKETPTEELIHRLRETLRKLSKAYIFMEMPKDADEETALEWMLHLNTVIVRGDGYQGHIREVYAEMFMPHSDFYKQRYGFSFNELMNFFEDVENRVVCKVGDENMIYGATKMHNRWVHWESEHNGGEPVLSKDFSNGIFGDFFAANPDVPHTSDGQQFLLYQPNDFTGTEKIFWIYPQNDAEKNIMEALSCTYGCNGAFLEDGDFRGNVMNGYNIFERPFIKDGDRYYCFTPMVIHRNLFLIAENLMKRDNSYYQTHFQQNKLSESRDRYVERKVKCLLEDFLPTAKFYSSLNYGVMEERNTKKAELDILGVSDKAIYLIEVKAHELSYKDRVGVKGTKEKFSNSVGVGCYQCWRAERHICCEETPMFSNITIDKWKPVYKIVVTFQHFSSLLGNYDCLVRGGWLDEKYRDTWIVSLFDLMIFNDFITSEEQFIEYLDMHKIIYASGSTYYDEIDVLAQFLNNNLKVQINKQIRKQKRVTIIGGSEDIDAEYATDFQLPIGGMIK